MRWRVPRHQAPPRAHFSGRGALGAAGARPWPAIDAMSVTRTDARARAAASAAGAPAAAQPCASKSSQPSAEADDQEEPVRRLPLRELAVDPAVLIFLLMHVLALATPWWWAGRATWRDAALVAASYTVRMFGACAEARVPLGAAQRAARA